MTASRVFVNPDWIKPKENQASFMGETFDAAFLRSVMWALVAPTPAKPSSEDDALNPSCHSLPELLYEIKSEYFDTFEAKLIWRAIEKARTDGLTFLNADAEKICHLMALNIEPTMTEKDINQLTAPLYTDVSTLNLNFMARKVIAAHLQREIDAVMRDSRSEVDGFNRRRKLEDSLMRLNMIGDQNKKRYMLNNDQLMAWTEDMERRLDAVDKVQPYFKTGYEGLDDKIGLTAGNLVVLGARSGVGKTSFLANLIHRYRNADYNVIFFSMEQTMLEVQNMLHAIGARVDLPKIQRADLTGEELDRISDDQRRSYGKDFTIVCDAKMTITSMRTLIDKAVVETGRKMDIVMIDHMHCMGDDRNFKDLRMKLVYITGELKAMAKEYSSVVIAAAQLNRDSDKEKRPPQMNDLKESGSIEQDADVILMLHRENHMKLEDQGASPLTNLYCRKNRSGTEGNFKLDFEHDPKTKITKEAKTAGERVSLANLTGVSYPQWEID
jgi:replicative DNA helicase